MSLEKRLHYWKYLYLHPLVRLLSAIYMFGNLFTLCIYVFGKAKATFNSMFLDKRQAIYNFRSLLCGCSFKNACLIRILLYMVVSRKGICVVAGLRSAYTSTALVTSVLFVINLSIPVVVFNHRSIVLVLVATTLSSPMILNIDHSNKALVVRLN